ncbi:MAG: response regulator transcription factor [Lysobacterales bacterium]|jgi:two-component system chemotaxis response regulator CheY
MDEQRSEVALVVDDSRVSRMMLSALLREQRPGLAIHEAADGAEAVARAAELRPDLVTLDINMPVMDGFEAAERIRAALPTATIVLLTANVQAASKARAETLGVHFLAKPITEAVVKQALALWGAGHG